MNYTDIFNQHNTLTLVLLQAGYFGNDQILEVTTKQKIKEESP